jgi:hypothetical protein
MVLVFAVEIVAVAVAVMGAVAVAVEIVAVAVAVMGAAVVAAAVCIVDVVCFGGVCSCLVLTQPSHNHM